MSDTNEFTQWSRMMENMNDAMAQSVEQNVEMGASFVEAWSDLLDGSIPEEAQLTESVEAYNAAYAVWMDAADRMFERITDAAEGEEVAVTELRDIWLQSANDAFKEVMDTTAFAGGTGALVEQLMETQRETEAASQDALERMGLPTRDDVDEVGERLIELERRQHAVEGTLDRVLANVDEIDGGLDRIDGGLAQIDEEMAELERNQRSVEETVDDVEEKVDRLHNVEETVDDIEEKVDRLHNVEETVDDVEETVDHIEDRLDEVLVRLEEEQNEEDVEGE